jgi:mono/diheme cytochrome c family protein
MKRIWMMSVSGLMAIAVVTGCASNAEPAKADVSVKAKPADGPVHTLKLPEDRDPALPAGKGLEMVVAKCAICHTPHYIMNQPAFSRETWTAEVTKMQKNYSAPVEPENVAAIVDYLVAVRGAAAR